MYRLAAPGQLGRREELQPGEQTDFPRALPCGFDLAHALWALCSPQRLMSVNYLGSVYPSRAVITTMKERRVGRIVFLSSQAGQVGLYGFTAYSSSKFAIRGLAEALQMEVNKRRIRFYVCSSGLSKCFLLVCSFFTRVVTLSYRFVDLTLAENWLDA